MAKQQLPGLAMTRAFGDTIGVKAGVIATPEIMEHDIKQGDCFLAAASDGVW
jgi:serine/threonine protein phosphatase PrpC